MKKLLLLGGLAVIGTQAAYAVDIKAGDWTVSVGGYVNAYYTAVDCNGATVGGTALASRALGCVGEDNRTTIGNGLLPNALVTSAKSTQEGFDVSATIAIMAHTATDSAIAANNGVDVRQSFFTFGKADLGTIKLGRDYGIFGQAAILNDMTLLGSGAPVQATQRGRVALGHIGAGYTYLGNYGQIAYTSPKWSGMQLDAALVSPVGNGAGFNSRSAPQVQAQLSYGVDTLKAWLGVKTQKFYATAPGVSDFNMNGIEAGASYTIGAFGLLGNVQAGDGLGILADGDQGDVRALNYLGQATYKTSDKLKFGVSYGRSNNRNTAAGLHYNENVTVGSYYALTKSITLVGELGQTRSKDRSGDTARMNGVSVGGIIFF